MKDKIKTLTGVVSSSSANKSIKVVIDYKIKHPKYGKYINRRMKFGVHDEHNMASVNDVVEIAQSRAYSKTKSWRLVKVVEKAAATE